MTTTTHLTPAELDALLEAAKAATPGPWQTRFIHRLFQSARRDPDLSMYTAPDQDWPDSEFIALANPATITRLALMVRELQQRLEQAQIETSVVNGSACREEQEAGNGPCRICRYCLAGGAVEHFRARAVRAIREQAQDWEKRSDFGKLSGYVNRSAAAFHLAKTIESLPLVETEGE